MQCRGKVRGWVRIRQVAVGQVNPGPQSRETEVGLSQIAIFHRISQQVYLPRTILTNLLDVLKALELQ
jgi:hypothetical protein